MQNLPNPKSRKICAQERAIDSPNLRLKTRNVRATGSRQLVIDT